MAYPPIPLDGFERREELLKSVYRYMDEQFPVMFYRTNDFVHSQRVLWHLESILPMAEQVYGSKFDVGLARMIALVHDDVEMNVGEDPVGDVQLYVKERMSPEERREMDRREGKVIQELSKMFPTLINGFHYGSLLFAAKEKLGLEAQLVSYCDKFDGFGEALHEVFAGNRYFIRPATTYPSRLRDFRKLYPKLRLLLGIEHPMFRIEDIDFKAVAEEGSLHTQDSIRVYSKYSPYEVWKANIMYKGGLKALTEQKERLQRSA